MFKTEQLPEEAMSSLHTDLMHQIIALYNKQMTIDYFSPKNYYRDFIKAFHIYVQPVLIVITIVCFSVMMYALRTDNFMKKYGFMILACSVDISILLCMSVMTNYALLRTEDYIEYDVCFLYTFVVEDLPEILVIFTQWVRVAQIFQRFVIMNKPLGYKQIFNKVSVTCFLVAVISICVGAGCVCFYFITFEKIYLLEKTTRKMVEVCRETSNFKSKQAMVDHYLIAFEYGMLSFQSVLPFVLMTGFTIGCHRALKRQIEFRSRFKVAGTQLQRSADRLMRANITSGIVSAVFTVVVATTKIMVIQIPATFDNMILFEVIGIIVTIIFIVTAPVNIFIFSWLSNSFRNSVVNVGKLCKKDE